MGSKLDSQDEWAMNYVKVIQKLSSVYPYRLRSPWGRSSFYYYNIDSVGKLETRLIKVAHDFTNKLIKKREATFENFAEKSNDYYERKKVAMLDLLLNAKNSDGIIDDEGIRDEVNTFLYEVQNAKQPLYV